MVDSDTTYPEWFGVLDFNYRKQARTYISVLVPRNMEETFWLSLQKTPCFNGLTSDSFVKQEDMEKCKFYLHFSRSGQISLRTLFNALFKDPEDKKSDIANQLRLAAVSAQDWKAVNSSHTEEEEALNAKLQASILAIQARKRKAQEERGLEEDEKMAYQTADTNFMQEDKVLDEQSLVEAKMKANFKQKTNTQLDKYMHGQKSPKGQSPEEEKQASNLRTERTEGTLFEEGNESNKASTAQKNGNLRRNPKTGSKNSIGMSGKGHKEQQNIQLLDQQLTSNTDLQEEVNLEENYEDAELEGEQKRSSEYEVGAVEEEVRVIEKKRIKTDLTQLSESVASLQQRLKSKEFISELAESVASKFPERLITVNKEKDDLQKKLSDSLSEVDDLKKKLAEADNNIRDIQKKIEESLITKKEREDNLTTLQEQLSDSLSEANYLKKKLAEADDTTKDLQEKLDESLSTKKELEDNLANLQKKLSESLSEVDELKKKLAEADSTTKDTEEKLKESLSTNKNLEDNLNNLQKNLSESISEGQKVRKSLEDAIVAAKDLKEKFDQLLCIKIECEGNLTNLTQERDRLLEKLQQSFTEKNNLKLKITTVFAGTKDASNDLTALKKKVEEVLGEVVGLYKNDITQLGNKSNEVIETMKKKLAAEIAEMKKKEESSQKTIKDQGEELMSSDSKILDLKTKLKECEKKNKILTESLLQSARNSKLVALKAMSRGRRLNTSATPSRRVQSDNPRKSPHKQSLDKNSARKQSVGKNSTRKQNPKNLGSLKKTSTTRLHEEETEINLRTGEFNLNDFMEIEEKAQSTIEETKQDDSTQLLSLDIGCLNSPLLPLTDEVLDAYLTLVKKSDSVIVLGSCTASKAADVYGLKKAQLDSNGFDKFFLESIIPYKYIVIPVKQKQLKIVKALVVTNNSLLSMPLEPTKSNEKSTRSKRRKQAVCGFDFIYLDSTGGKKSQADLNTCNAIDYVFKNLAKINTEYEHDSIPLTYILLPAFSKTEDSALFAAHNIELFCADPEYFTGVYHENSRTLYNPEEIEINKKHEMKISFILSGKYRFD